MEGYSRNDEDCPQLLDLIPKKREWVVKREEERSHGSSEEKKLELRLGPPGEDWTIKNDTTKNSIERDSTKYYFSNMNNTSGAKRGFIDTVGTLSSSSWSSSGYHQVKAQHTKSPFLQLQSNPQGLTAMAKESSQPCCTKVVDIQTAEKKGFSPSTVNTAVPNSSQKRSAPTPVVGWPPIRSYRKNLASSSSSKQASDSQKVVQDKVAAGEKPSGSCTKGLFVKINMDGIPIGRKVDLKAYDSYEELSSAVDELFSGLLAAQIDSSANKQEGGKAITGLLDGSGEYTLVYEDNEGDRMLVGDVPWHMFVSTVKRLRVLKSSEVPTLCLGSKQQEKASLNAVL